MGATRKYLPLTWGFTLVASLSLIGLPPFPGFWSKDAVLLAALEANLTLFVLALVTVAITAFYTVRFLGIVFFGPESENVVHVKKEGGHLNDGALSMRAASGLLAVLIVVAGLGGPLLEHVLQEGFAASLGSVSAEVVVPVEEEASSHGVVPILSLLFLAAGALPAYYLFIARRRSPSALLESHSFFQALYTFFWNRWFIDAFYRRVFVDGTMRLASLVANVEDGWDRLVHRKLPFMLTEKLQQTTRRLHTETEELFYNVSYVLVLLILFLTFFIAGTSGN
jgi:NADH-quinone oxidoreductase subunit L